MKFFSVPRLELLSCVLLSDLIEDVYRALSGRIWVKKTVCWTDSLVALCWIQGKEKSWKPWVENRVVKIRKVVDREFWFHVAGVDNPADSPTRKVEDFGNLFSGLWFSGLSFLWNDEITYLDRNDKILVTEAKQELKTSTDEHKILTVAAQKAIGLNEIVDSSRYSSLKKLINVVAYVVRFKTTLWQRFETTIMGSI